MTTRMTPYKNLWDYYRDTARLIQDGATLRTLYDALLQVQSDDMRTVDASPKRLREMTQSWSQRPNFLPIRLNELFNGLQVDPTDDYVLALVGGLGGRHEQEVRLFMLRHDHALRDNVFWRVFEVEGGGEISLANIDKFSREEFNWHNTVVLLANEGTLDRRRVLRSCLEALNRDFSAYRAGWYSRVYATLAPTPDEVAADQQLLRLCLGSSITATVSLAVKQFETLHKHDLLDATPFVDACGGAFSGPKAAALSVLRILEALGAQARVDSQALAQALALGLGHPHADVQRAAVKALVKMGRVDLAQQQRDALAPAVAVLLPQAEAAETEEPVDKGLAASASAPGLSGTPSDLPSPAPLNPWTDDDAQERYAALLEAPADALEFELALAWLATSRQVAAMIAPLVKRARRLAERDRQHYAAALLLAAHEPKVPFLPLQYWQNTSTSLVNGEWVQEREGKRQALPSAEQSTLLPSFITRLREVAAIVQGQASRRPLLATPTDTQGWVDADALLARFEAGRESGAPLPVDLTQALLRVHPEHRARAVEATGGAWPQITDTVQIEWRSRGSSTLKADGSPQWVWWSPVIHAAPDEAPSATQPALIASGPLQYNDWGDAHALVCAELGLANPASTLPLAAASMAIMNTAAGDEAEHRAPTVLRVLAGHPGAWHAETVQLLALGMAAKQAEVRAQAVEAFAAAIPHRVDATAAAQAYAACVPAIVLTRWATSFTDAATMAPAAVIAVLGGLLPRLDPKTRGIGSLLTVLLDESLRHAHPVQAADLRGWLAGFTGTSAAAKAAKALLAL
ncbi:hypothetical protein LMG3458_01323 [Achromobacter deleyi]|uniref:DUF6493 domain-containing protein n=1 Tax=Achromobacter deleyi TaxID=1353891 RepID=A0A6S6ZEZ3_9BURK|nr:DUF6493 family protein [Achromobacter deleyi]CAB3675401.1 hypothetical protein LMG3458_01323 [Achromobacter deleyi]CAB3837949.1 hypothetical protein LMG3481_01104 [Achromobacter deleyi]CAB3842007.1 hypothetical protein LMG3482_01313 [Achromobacter deleyi]